MFQFLQPQRAVLTSFTGRTETHGRERVPAVSFRLKFTGPNTLLDLLSPSLRLAVYTAAEGQEDLPGVEPATPLLRSRDVKHLALDNAYEGWTVHLEHGIDESTHLEMGSAKIDAFAVDFHDGGTVDIECRVSTADLDRHGAGLLWSKQTLEVPVCFIAPKALETNPNAGQVIDGTTGHPGAGLFDGPEDSGSEGGEPDATDAFVAQHADAAPAETMEERVARGEPAWPFPEGDSRALANGKPASGPKARSEPAPKKSRGRKKAEATA